jgi:hypothetical protein
VGQALLWASLVGCASPEFAVPISFVVPQGHDSFADLDFLALEARYDDGRSYDFWLQAPSSGTEWSIPDLPAGTGVTLAFEGLVSDGLGGDGQVVAASGSAGPLAFDPEVAASARVLFTRRGRTGTLPGGAHPALDPEVVAVRGGLLALGGANGYGEEDPVSLDDASFFGVDGTADAFGFVAIEPMRGPRMDFAAVFVEGSGTDYDGKVAVVGSLGLVEGRSSLIVTDLDQDTLDEARDIGIPEVFDPDTGTWEDLADDDVMREYAARGHHGLVQLGDALFVLGGIVFDDGLGLRATAETLRIPLDGGETEVVSAMGETRWRHTATRIGSDRLLVVGGAAVPTSSVTYPEVSLVERYDAGDDAWVELGDLEPARGDHVAISLPDGRVLVAGGVTDTDSVALGDCWLIDPDAGTFTQGPDLAFPRARATGRLIAGGQAIVCGGEDASGAPVPGCEVWSPGGADGLGAWAPAPDPAGAWTGRIGSAVGVLGTGEVVVVGGQDAVGLPVDDLLLYRP